MVVVVVSVLAHVDMGRGNRDGRLGKKDGQSDLRRFVVDQEAKV
jgi:hypothetical protein